jgi:hypothetical protein
MVSKYTQYEITATVATGATSATAKLGKAIRGKIIAIKTVLTNSTPASSSDRDIDLYEMNPAAPTTVAKAIQHILDVGSVGAAPEDDNAVYYPRTPSQDLQGTDVTYDSTNEIYEPFVVFGDLYLSVTNAAAGDITKLYLIVEEY